MIFLFHSFWASCQVISFIILYFIFRSDIYAFSLSLSLTFTTGLYFVWSFSLFLSSYSDARSIFDIVLCNKKHFLKLPLSHIFIYFCSNIFFFLYFIFRSDIYAFSLSLSLTFTTGLYFVWSFSLFLSSYSDARSIFDIVLCNKKHFLKLPLSHIFIYLGFIPLLYLYIYSTGEKIKEARKLITYLAKTRAVCCRLRRR